MAMSLKCGTATLAAIVFLLYGVDVAQAGGIGDVVDDVPVAESALPTREDAAPGDVVEQTTQAVEEVTEAVDEAVEPVDAEAVVSAAKGALDEAVTDPTGTVENTIAELSSTVDGVAGVVGNFVDSSPVGKGASGATDIVNPVVSAADKTEASRFEAAGSAPSRQQSESAQEPASRAPKGSQMRFAAPEQLTARADAPGIVVRPIVTVPGSGAQQASSTRGLLAPSVLWKDALSALEPAMSHEASSAAPAAPFAPPPSGDQPATAASVAGAGAALLAALFSAFLFLAPRNGRLARPGSILAWPEPCLSLAERPG